MLTCPHCNGPGIRLAQKLSLGHSKPALCNRCGGAVVLPLRAQASIIPLVVLLLVGPSLFLTFGKLWVSVGVGVAVVLVPILNVVLFRTVPFRGPPASREPFPGALDSSGAESVAFKTGAAGRVAASPHRESDREAGGYPSSSTTVAPPTIEERTDTRERHHALVKLVSLLVLAIVCAAGARYAEAYRRTPALPSTLVERRATEHFVVYSNLEEGPLDLLVRFFEKFREYFDESWFAVPPGRRLRLFLFADTATYEPYVRENFRGYTTYGFYIPEHDLVVVNSEMGVGTATHMLVRHFVAASFARPPPRWIEDGFATFFEKFIGYFDADGELHISFGYFSNWRFPTTKSVGHLLSIDALVAAKDVDQSAARSLMLYLHKQGHLREFIDSVRRHDGSDSTGLLAKVTGRSLEDLEQGWKGWIEWQPVDANVRLVSESFVKSHEEWKAWWRANSGRLYWSEKERIYKVRGADAPGSPLGR